MMNTRPDKCLKHRPSSGAATALLGVLRPQLAACLRQPPSYRLASVSRLKSIVNFVQDATASVTARASNIPRILCIEPELKAMGTYTLLHFSH